MTYRPSAEFFGPPLSLRLIGLVHGGAAILVFAFVFYVEYIALNSAAHEYMFEQKHYIDTHTAAGAFALSALFSVMRDGMRGVKIKAHWIEYRDLISAVWPRVRKFRWAQIEGMTFEESGAISLDLWNGTREFLPPVRSTGELQVVLERLAIARAIPVRGGQGNAVLDELPGPA